MKNIQRLRFWIDVTFVTSMIGCLITVHLLKDDFIGDMVATASMVAVVIYLVLMLVYIGVTAFSCYDLCRLGAKPRDLAEEAYHVQLLKMWATLNHAATAVANSFDNIGLYTVLPKQVVNYTARHAFRHRDLAQYAFDRVLCSMDQYSDTNNG